MSNSLTAASWLNACILTILKDEFGIEGIQLQVSETPDHFEGNLTVNVFPIVKLSKLSPEATGKVIGEAILKDTLHFASYNVIKGFLNITLTDLRWAEYLQSFDVKTELSAIQSSVPEDNIVMVEYSSPNTNKPLHLGHLRNIFLGESLCRMLEVNGFQVIRATLVNDRGVHICKSMLAWIRTGNGETPESSGIKGDHLVGKYYVAYEKLYRAEVQTLMEAGVSKEEAEKQAPIQQAVQNMLAAWEAGDESVLQVWRTMNGWVYAGFEQTYKRLGIQFDRSYYESNTYLLGKEVVEEGLQKGIFYTKENGSIWADLNAYKLDEKLVLRADGTSVYITQDLGTARLKHAEYGVHRSIYVIGNEQEHQMKALFAILELLGESYAKGLYHLSYGMVELPSGKMKSREGTVVDADDLIAGMVSIAKEKTLALGKAGDESAAELEALYEILGIGALRYFLLKVDPKKGMLFDPEESIDFKGNTAPFIQYSFARIQSLLRKANATGEVSFQQDSVQLAAAETALLIQLSMFRNAIKIETHHDYDPGRIANYVYEVASRFSRFYNEIPVLKSDNANQIAFRLQLCKKTADVIQCCLSILGIEAPVKM
jgi:arginyl-tRNA synthetase